jgi:hypothetical protein
MPDKTEVLEWRGRPLPPPSRDVVGGTVEDPRGEIAQPPPEASDWSSLPAIQYRPDVMLLSYLQALQHEVWQHPETTNETGRRPATG